MPLTSPSVALPSFAGGVPQFDGADRGVPSRRTMVTWQLPPTGQDTLSLSAFQTKNTPPLAVPPQQSPLPKAPDPATYRSAIAALPGAESMPPEIYHALIELGQIQNPPWADTYLRSIGVDVLFKNGMEALNLITSKGIRVDFGDMGNSKAHAQWLKDENLIMINQRYQGDTSKATLYAISEAIYHEAGHASRNGDNQASIQEEINCLGMNTLGYLYHVMTDADYAANTSNSRLIQDGVALYAKLFFDPDPNKLALIGRVIEKYGYLPAHTPDHPIPVLPGKVPLTYLVLEQLQNRRAKEWIG